MSDTNEPGTTPDATPTEALELADQQPLGAQPAAAPAPAPAAVPVAARTNHTRTILEVVGGAVAVGLILVAGVFGFLVGHATGSDRDGRWSMTSSRGDLQNGPDAGAPLGGQQGQDPRGFDPDGDDWTGGRDGREGQPMPGMPGMPGQDGQLMPGMPGQDPRGIDPDGDNWTGGQDEDEDATTTPSFPQQS